MVQASEVGVHFGSSFWCRCVHLCSQNIQVSWTGVHFGCKMSDILKYEFCCIKQSKFEIFKVFTIRLQQYIVHIFVHFSLNTFIIVINIYCIHHIKCQQFKIFNIRKNLHTAWIWWWNLYTILEKLVLAKHYCTPTSTIVHLLIRFVSASYVPLLSRLV